MFKWREREIQVQETEKVNLLFSRLEGAEVDSRLGGGVMSDRAFPSALSQHILPRVLCICPLVALRRPFLSRYVCVDWFTICFRPKGKENKLPPLLFEDKAVQWCANEFGDCVLTRQICLTFRQCFKDPNCVCMCVRACVRLCVCVCVCVCVLLCKWLTH